MLRVLLLAMGMSMEGAAEDMIDFLRPAAVDDMAGGQERETATA